MESWWREENSSKLDQTKCCCIYRHILHLLLLSISSLSGVGVRNWTNAFSQNLNEGQQSACRTEQDNYRAKTRDEERRKEIDSIEEAIVIVSHFPKKKFFKVHSPLLSALELSTLLSLLTLYNCVLERTLLHSSEGGRGKTYFSRPTVFFPVPLSKGSWCEWNIG